MRIDKTNYEIWFIDYLEGNLASDSVAELRAFLLLHPDLADELELLENSGHQSARHIAPELKFHEKLNLKKSEELVNTSLLDELLAKEFEGHLTAEEKDELVQLSSSYPDFVIHQHAMHRAKLAAEHISFDHKELIHCPDIINLQDDEMMLVALLEGDLEPDDANALRKRIENEPALAEDFRNLSRSKFESEPIHSGIAAKLTFPESVDYSDDQMLIASYADGGLDDAMSWIASQKIATDPQLALDFELMKSAVLQPESISFPSKNSLYKKATVVIPFAPFIRYASAAAAVLALIVWFTYYRSGAEAEIAQNPSHPLNEIVDEHSSGQKTAQPSNETQEPKNEEVIHHSIQNSTDNIASNENPKPVNITPLTPEEEVAIRPDAPVKLHSIDGGLLPKEQNYHELAVIIPDMKEVHQPVYTSTAQKEEDKTTLLELLGRAAAEKLESTYAYSLAERQFNKISDKTKSEIELNSAIADRQKLRLGPFAVERNRKKSKTEPKGGIIGKIERLYNKVAGDE